MRLPFSGGKRHRPSAGNSPRHDSVQLLADYVVAMSLASLADRDVDALYRDYKDDGRLGASERKELAEAFQVLRGRS